MWTYEFEIRWPNQARPEGWSTGGTYTARRPYFTERGAGRAMERRIRGLTNGRWGTFYSAQEYVRRTNGCPF